MPEFDYMTQIIFDNHLLVLRYKKKDTVTEKYHWTIHSSWEPPMESSRVASALKTPVGNIATPSPESSLITKANSAVFGDTRGTLQQVLLLQAWSLQCTLNC